MNFNKQKLLSSASEILKSGGTYFMTGNAAANSETNPWIALGYGAAFFGQALAQNQSNPPQRQVSPIASFFAGKQGGLATNAVMTFGVGALTVLTGGSALLGGAMLAFGAANMGQALIYDGRITFTKPIQKSFALAACEVGMIGGFALLGAHVGMGLKTVSVIAGVGAFFAGVRSFRPNAIHPDLAYGDMLVTATCTLVQAVATHHYLIAASRVLAIAGISRLAVLRARNDKKTSFMEVEKHVPVLVSKTRTAFNRLVKLAA